MEKLHFSIFINAPKEKVYGIMLADKTYRQWTKVFDPGSYYEGDWSEGSKIRFIGPDKDGKKSGMISRVAANRPNEFVSIEHLGEIKDGVEDTTSHWSGAHENYTFLEKDLPDGSQAVGTELLIDLDTVPEFKEMFEGMWPKALEKLKEICEA